MACADVSVSHIESRSADRDLARAALVMANALRGSRVSEAEREEIQRFLEDTRDEGNRHD